MPILPEYIYYFVQLDLFWVGMLYWIHACAVVLSSVERLAKAISNLLKLFQNQHLKLPLSYEIESIGRITVMQTTTYLYLRNNDV